MKSCRADARLFRLRQDDLARDAKSLLLRHELAVHRRIATPPRAGVDAWH
jgi:hypothetical protein